MTEHTNCLLHGEGVPKIKGDCSACYFERQLDHESDRVCPFCLEGGFDRPGLKWHLLNDCEIYSATEEL